VAIPLLALNAWRLSLLFAISGYASAAVFHRAKGTGAFLRSRLARLGIPLLFGMTVVVAPQPWTWLVTANHYPHSFAYFMAHDYFSFRDMGGIVVPSWMHLWFVVYLLAYTLVLCALHLMPDGLRVSLRHGAERLLAGPLLLPLGIIWIYLARSLPGEWSDTHTLVKDPAAHMAYLPVFLFGVLLRSSEPLRIALARQWKVAAVLASAGYMVVAACELYFPGDTLIPQPWREPFRIARAAQGWGAIIALFGMADRYWNREGRWRATLAEAVFPFYIIHQTLIMVTGFWLRPFALAPLTEFAILVLVTAAGCALFYFGGRMIRPLRPLIGLKRTARRPHAPVEPPPGAAEGSAPG
jgi:glucan biosynthesis protein C